MTEENNFLQQLNHCSTCHTDYFGDHHCIVTTGMTSSCGKCIANELVKNPPNNYKYCPHCGKTL